MVSLSEIHLKNFKSFKNCVLKIPEGFTAIVGPNGSGKSNIIDSICFVIGKTSAKSLRAGRLSHLITYHKGKREDFTEVILFFDNKDRKIPIDSDRVGICRKVKLKGDSNYYIIWEEKDGKSIKVNEKDEIVDNSSKVDDKETIDNSSDDKNNNKNNTNNINNNGNTNNGNNNINNNINDINNNTNTNTNTNNKTSKKVIEKRKKVKKSYIVDIFNKLAIGGGLNIILQGDLIKLIDMTPKDRRKVIDEICGISEYDEKKEKAQIELNKARDYIEKIDIRINEVKNNLQRLKKEKEDAEKYLKYNKELKISKYLLTVKRIEFLKNVLNNIEDNIKGLNDLKKRFNSEIEEIDKKIEELNKKLENIVNELKERGNEEIMELHKSIKELEVCIETDRKNLNNSIEELRTTEENLSYKEKELSLTREKIEALRKETMEKEKEIKNILKELDNLNNEKKSLKSVVEKSETHINVLKQQERKLSERLNEYQKELHKLQMEHNKVSQRLTNLKYNYEKNEEEIKRLMEELNTLKNEKNNTVEIYKELEDVSVELNYSKKLLNELEEERKKLIKRRDELYSEYAKENAKIKAMKEMENFNLNNTIKQLLNANLPGIIDIVGNLGKTKQEYKTAIEIAGGNRLNYVVVKRTEDGIRAIDYLKRNRLGRCTFLPLDRIKGNEGKIINEDGVIGRAVDLVEFDEKYRDIFNYVFGNTIIVRDIYTATELSKKYRLRFVSLDGDVVEPSGAMVGGSVRRSSSIKIDIDESKLKKLAKELKDIEEKLNGNNGVNRRLEELQRKVNEYSLKKSELENKLNLIKNNENKKLNIINNNENKIKELKLKNKKLLEEIDELNEVVDELNHKIKDIEDKINETLATKERVLKELKSYEDRSYIKRIRELDNKIEELNKRKDSLENEIKRDAVLVKEVLIPKMKENNDKIKELKEKIDILRKNIDFYKNSIEKNGKLLREKKYKYEELTKNLKELTDIKEKYEKEIKELNAKKQELITKISETEKSINDLLVDKAKYESKLEEEDKKLYLLEEEGINKNNSGVYSVLEQMTIEELERNVSKIENLIKKLGPINMKSLEDYEYINSRYNELYEKRKEYEKDEKKYLQLIEEIEKRKKEVFMEVFNKVSKNYEEIYKEIGGSGKLSLENPDNPFEGGLLIDASPKNKELQSLDVMSGGEKSLTALAFLFAIQKLTPSPFYVLDEVDAALDTKNAALIGEMIKNASKNSQFIVISHREQLISKADTLYGVYMKDGLSEIVGLKL